ncbi:MAG TPA: hypothetical protein VGH28_30525 [Polyangiaceae bacterium]
MKLLVAERAQRQIAKIDQFWFEHRFDAETLFLDELAATFRMLSTVRHAGTRWPTPQRPALRRILMPRSLNHVYFVVDEASQTVRVLAVWGAKKRRTPKL